MIIIKKDFAENSLMIIKWNLSPQCWVPRNRQKNKNENKHKHNIPDKNDYYINKTLPKLIFMIIRWNSPFNVCICGLLFLCLLVFRNFLSVVRRPTLRAKFTLWTWKLFSAKSYLYNNHFPRGFAKKDVLLIPHMRTLKGEIHFMIEIMLTDLYSL